MHREWSTGPFPVSLPRHAVTREGGEAAGCVGIYKEKETIQRQRRGGKSSLLGGSQEEENANELSLAESLIAV